MRLSSLIPEISAESVRHLEASGIRTDSDLLFTPLLELYKKLEPNTHSLQDLARLCATVTELCAAPVTLATDLLESENHASARDIELAVGDEAVDDLLRGLGGPRLVEISGDRATGKSVRLSTTNLSRQAKCSTPIGTPETCSQPISESSGQRC